MGSPARQGADERGVQPGAASATSDDLPLSQPLEAGRPKRLGRRVAGAQEAPPAHLERRTQPGRSRATRAVRLGPRLVVVILLRRGGWQVSTSMVGRILSSLKRRGVLLEPPRRAVSATKRRPRRPYPIRKPRDYQACQPGDIVQVDTLDLRPLPGVILKHFTARDVVSRWDVVEVYSVATARTATDF